MKKSMLSMLLCWALLFPFVAAAGPFTDLFVFGDSLSDQGNVRLLTGGLVPPNEYTDGINDGRFTNGLNYIDSLAASLGLSSSWSLDPDGGNNYAYGGARTDSQSVGGNPVDKALSILAQKDLFISDLVGGSADPNALFVVWAGANNLIDIVETAGAFPSSYDPTADLTKAVTDVGTIVSGLAAKGARNILVPNLPDFGVLPLVTRGLVDRVQGATDLTVAFNSSLGLVLDGVEGFFGAFNIDLNLVRFDTFGLFNAVLADPAAFGFSNTTAACYSKFGEAGGTTCANPDEYVSWDGFHPTSALHSLVGSRMASAVPEPNIFVLIVMGVFSLGAFIRLAQKTV